MQSLREAELRSMSGEDLGAGNANKGYILYKLSVNRSKDGERAGGAR